MNRTEKKVLLNQKIKESEEILEEKLEQYKAIGKDVLVIGGILVAGFAIMKLFSSEDKEEVEVKSNEDSVVYSALKGAAISFALGLAKEKLLGLVDSMKKDESIEEDN